MRKTGWLRTGDQRSVHGVEAGVGTGLGRTVTHGSSNAAVNVPSFSAEGHGEALMIVATFPSQQRLSCRREALEAGAAPEFFLIGTRRQVSIKDFISHKALVYLTAILS